MSTDATRCTKCGGEFSRKRIIIEGNAYHEGCAIMSYPPHTPEDASRLSGEIDRLRGLLLKAQWVLGAAVQGKPVTVAAADVHREISTALAPR